MRKVALPLVIGLLGVTTTTILAADPSTSTGSASSPFMDGRSLADALMQWDGYDFTEAGNDWPGALRSGPSDASSPDDPYGGDGTVLILPDLDGPAHVLVEARLSQAGQPLVWSNVQRIMSELQFSDDDQRAVYGGLGQVLGESYANASDEQRTDDAAIWVANGLVLLEGRTQGFETPTDGQPTPIVPVPLGGIQLEIVPTGESPSVLPIPEPTSAPTPEPTEAPTTEPTEAPTARPVRTARPTPRPTAKATRRPTATAAAGEAPAPTTDDWICDGSEDIIGDPYLSGWNVNRVDWRKRNGYDRLIVTLDRRKPGGENFEVQADARVMPADEVGPTLGVRQPSQGATAIALGFMDDIHLGWNLDRPLNGLNTVRSVTLGRDADGVPWLVAGSDGNGCYSLQVPAWTAHHPTEDQRVQVFLDIQRP